jgi:hypothetical protein
MKKLIFSLFLLGLASQWGAGQSMLDLTVGTSNLDRFMTNIALRRQVSDRFRVGLELQYGAPRYRFVDARPIREGYSGIVSVPLSLRLYEKDRMRLDFYARTGLRFQGIIDPDDNGVRDSRLQSTTLLIEPGLIVTTGITSKVDLQSGITFPVAFQIAPLSLFEALHAPLVYTGLNFKATDKRSFFIKTQFGAAFGADGDTYKFSYTLQAGARFALGTVPVSAVLEPTF